MAKDIKCYFCKEKVDGEYLVETIPLQTTAGIRNYKRQFHKDCLPQFKELGKPMPKKATKAPSTMKESKVHRCYYCDGVIESLNDLVWKKYSVAGKHGKKIWKNRSLHVNCLIKYNQERDDVQLKKEEQSDWDAVYQYFRNDILGLPKTVPLDEHTVRRLNGLRLGQYYPLGQNTRILPRGYDYKTILVTLKVVKAKVRQYIATANFANAKHRIDGIMRFVTGEINDVYKRLELQRKSNEKTKNDAPIVESVDYKDIILQRKKKEQEQNQNQNETKGNIIHDIDQLFGGIL